MDISLLLDRFEGRWRLERHIEQEGAAMQGVATFSRAGEDRLLYDEAGQLTLRDGQIIRCTRRYQFVARGETLVILFNDGPDAGKTFVALACGDDGPDVLTAADPHLCGQDSYTVVYRLGLPHAYETDILVAGPHKNYRAVSRYTRL